MNMDLNPLDPKKKLMDALMPGGTAVDPLAPPSAGPEIGGMETMPTSIPDPLAPPKGPTAPSRTPVTVGSNGYSTTTPGRPFLLGFDTGKLLDPSSGAADGSKYTPAAKAFGQAYLGGTDIGRGNLEPMVTYLKANGFPNATSDGKQKIDFGDGAGLIDVVGSDGSIRFQNTTDNAGWEAQHGGGGSSGTGAAGAAPSVGSGGIPGPMNSSLDPLLQGGDVMAKIQAALKQLSGPRSNAEALFAGLGGKR